VCRFLGIHSRPRQSLKNEAPPPEAKGDATPPVDTTLLGDRVSGKAGSADRAAVGADGLLDDTPLVSAGSVEVGEKSGSGLPELVAAALEEKSDSLTSDSGCSLGTLRSVVKRKS
jgi:hypothetical protein